MLNVFGNHVFIVTCSFDLWGTCLVLFYQRTKSRNIIIDLITSIIYLFFQNIDVPMPVYVPVESVVIPYL